TVVGQHDDRLTGEAMSRGWHVTPAGKVYSFYSRLAWNGDVLEYHGGDRQSYWAVRAPDGRTVLTLLNDSDRAADKKVRIAGHFATVSAPPRTIVSVDEAGREIERLALPY